jgi:tRNA dimethylallyltransferase
MARAEHRLYRFLGPSEALSAVKWAELAAREIGSAANGSAMVVGGTGFYIKVLAEGISPVPDVPHEGAAPDYGYLRRIDPDTRIAPSDAQRISRAIEVFEATGIPLSEWQKKPKRKFLDADFSIEVVDIPAGELDARIERRTRRMLASGAIGEVAALFAPPSAPISDVIGVREIRAHLAGAMDLEELERAIVLRTRQYAKRQRTFFRTQFPLARRIAAI